jgi:branched-chain amino acid transport system permease protein
MAYAASLTMVIGYAGIPAVAPTAFGAIGGYMAAWLALRAGWDSYTSVLAAMALTALVALVLSSFVLQLPSGFVILLTVSLATIVVGIIPQLSSLGGPYGLDGIPTSTFFGLHMIRPSDFILPTAILAGLAYFLVRRIGDSPFGLVLRAVREDEVALRGCGLNPMPAKVSVFIASAAMAGAAGAALAFYDQVITPNSFDFTSAILIVAVAIIGGVGRPVGAVVGAVFIQTVPQLLQEFLKMSPTIASLVQQMVWGFALVAVMIVRPSGIFTEKSSRIVRLYVKRHKGLERSSRPTVTPVSRSTIAGDIALHAEALRKSFGGIVAANGFDFELTTGGRVVGLVGPNGAGKTTLFNLLTGALRKDSGTVTLFGRTITASRMEQVVAAGMARSFQDVRLWPSLTTLENVFLGALKPGDGRFDSIFSTSGHRKRVQSALDLSMELLVKVGLEEKALILARDLSYGEQKLVGLARLMATQARVLLLDEPAAGVGADIQRQILSLIRELAEDGTTILLVEHNLEVVRDVATWCYFMEQGSIRAEGSYQQLISDPALAESYFGRSHQARTPTVEAVHDHD